MPITVNGVGTVYTKAEVDGLIGSLTSQSTVVRNLGDTVSSKIDNVTNDLSKLKKEVKDDFEAFKVNVNSITQFLETATNDKINLINSELSKDFEDFEVRLKEMERFFKQYLRDELYSKNGISKNELDKLLAQSFQSILQTTISIDERFANIEFQKVQIKELDKSTIDNAKIKLAELVNNFIGFLESGEIEVPPKLLTILLEIFKELAQSAEVNIAFPDSITLAKIKTS